MQCVIRWGGECEGGDDKVQCSLYLLSYHAMCGGFKRVEQLLKLGSMNSSWQCESCRRGKEDLRTIIMELRSGKTTVEDMKYEFLNFEICFNVLGSCRQFSKEDNLF